MYFVSVHFFRSVFYIMRLLSKSILLRFDYHNICLTVDSAASSSLLLSASTKFAAPLKVPIIVIMICYNDFKKKPEYQRHRQKG